MQNRLEPIDRPRADRCALLVGFPRMTCDALADALAIVADVTAVPFPGERFDRAAEELDPDLIVVDVTYLDERTVRPLVARRFRSSGSLIAYVRDDQAGCMIDDLATGRQYSLAAARVDEIVDLAVRPRLREVPAP